MTVALNVSAESEVSRGVGVGVGGVPFSFFLVQIPD